MNINEEIKRYRAILEGSEFVPNPFPNSIVQYPLYHGTNIEFNKFLRPAHGIYVSPSRTWANDIYGQGGYVVALYANIKRMYRPTDDSEIDPFYDREYEKVAELLREWSSQGYNACMFGGESESMVLFNGVELVNAKTGNPM